MRPRYQEIAAAQIPEIERADGTRIRVVSGRVETQLGDGVRGPVTEIAADPTYLDVTVPAGGRFAHPIPRGHTAFAYPFDGAGVFAPDAGPTSSPNLVVYGDGDRVEVRAGAQGVRFLLVSGRPLGEPIARYGPFVMNTRAEIEQALRDLHNGTFVWRPEQ
jgi:redox-sensitive bicupin YhaK (pirin superfamily)